MKIAFIISSLGSGGAERVVVNLANELSKKHKIVILTFSKDKPFYELNSNIKLIQLDLLKNSKNKLETIINSFKRIFILKKVLKKIKADINISFMTHTNILSIIASKFNRQKIIISERIEYNFYNSFMNFFKKLFYPLSDYLILQTFSDMKNYYFVKNKKVIYNPLNIKDSRIKIKKESFILAVGRLDKQKGFDNLIKIYSKIDTNWKLYIAGEGIEKANLKKIITELNLENKIILLGKRKDIFDWYKKASIFVLSSKKEGFPNVLIEAMAFGCAVVSFNCPYGPSEIIQDGVNGILVENKNLEALKEAIEKLIKDKKLRNNLSKEAIKVREKYSIAKIAKEWENVIKEVVK